MTQVGGPKIRPKTKGAKTIKSGPPSPDESFAQTHVDEQVVAPKAKVEPPKTWKGMDLERTVQQAKSKPSTEAPSTSWMGLDTWKSVWTSTMDAVAYTADTMLDALAADPWQVRTGVPDTYRLAYSPPQRGSKSAAYAVEPAAFYNRQDLWGSPVHIGVPLPSSQHASVRGRHRERYHTIVPKDYARAPHQYLTTGDGRQQRIEPTEQPYHQEVADQLYQAAKAKFAELASKGHVNPSDWRPKAIRQRIARAMHTRCQTFDADIAKVMMEQAQKTAASNSAEHMGMATVTHGAHVYDTNGATLDMKTYQAYQQRIVAPDGSIQRSLFVVRRQGLMGLEHGVLQDENVFVSQEIPLTEKDLQNQKPAGVFTVEFAGGGKVAIHIGDTGKPGASRPFMSARDLER